MVGFVSSVQKNGIFVSVIDGLDSTGSVEASSTAKPAQVRSWKAEGMVWSILQHDPPGIVPRYRSTKLEDLVIAEIPSRFANCAGISFAAKKPIEFQMRDGDVLLRRMSLLLCFYILSIFVPVFLRGGGWTW